MVLLAVGTTVTAAVVAHQLGYFDRPDFEQASSLCRTTSSGLQFIAVVAISTDPNIAGASDALYEGVQRGLESLEQGNKMLERAAGIYGTPRGSKRVRVGIFGDELTTEGHSRWGAGWAVAMSKFRDIEKLLESVQQASGLTEDLRAVRVEGPQVLKATIPWRNKFTPMVGAMVQWSRAFDAYCDLECTADCGRQGVDGTICMEVAVLDENDQFVWVDYILLHGDTCEVWDDAFPELVTFTNPKETVIETVSGETNDEEVSSKKNPSECEEL